MLYNSAVQYMVPVLLTPCRMKQAAQCQMGYHPPSIHVTRTVGISSEESLWLALGVQILPMSVVSVWQAIIAPVRTRMRVWAANVFWSHDVLQYFYRKSDHPLWSWALSLYAVLS